MSGFRSDFKIIVIGTSGTGKTSLVKKWIKNLFIEVYKATNEAELGLNLLKKMAKNIVSNFGI